MKTSRIIPLLAAVILLSCSGKDRIVTKVEGGRIEGLVSDGTAIFRGIPYAAPPTGGLRFAPPSEVRPWKGVRDATRFGNAALQDFITDGLYYKEFYASGLPTLSEDCLYLNIWAPKEAVGSKRSRLPVVLWLHGGSFDHGWSWEPPMSGEAWTREGVIMVSANYRVGIPGFMAHPALTAEQGTSGNYGILDQIAALRWIRDNISAFGGDGENITVAGQSAGAISVKYLLASPEAGHLISKAIIQSGGGLERRISAYPDTQGGADSLGKAIADISGIKTAGQLRNTLWEELKASYSAVTAGNWMMFMPHIDSVTIVKDFPEAVADGSIADVPIMIGWVKADGDVLGGKAVTDFCTLRSSLSDKPVFSYLFSRDLPGEGPGEPDPGAFHSSEMWYTFGTLDKCWRPFTEGDRELSRRMVSAWTSFIKKGHPGGLWRPYTQDDPYIEQFDVPTP